MGIDECYEQARQILHDNRDKLDAMAEALMKFETIDASQLKDIMEGRDPRPPEGWNDGDSSGGGMRISDDKPEAKADEQSLSLSLSLSLSVTLSLCLCLSIFISLALP